MKLRRLLCGWVLLGLVVSGGQAKSEGTPIELPTSAVGAAVAEAVKPASKSGGTLAACRGIPGIKTDRKVVALTFDDGPSRDYTLSILELLEAQGVKATFFMVGTNVLEFPEVVRRLYQAGHVIANHSYSHRRLAILDGAEVEQQLLNCNHAIFSVIGRQPLFFRPPYGACSNISYEVAKNLGMVTVMWRSITDDYNVRTTSSRKIAREILALVSPGAIIALHDGGGNRRKTVEALAIIITELKKQGYTFLTITELLGLPAYR